MSLCFIVDGYNVIKRSLRFDDNDLRASRLKFLRFLETSRPHGSSRNSLTVVFDGSTEVVGFCEEWTFQVIFSLGESADDRIKKMVSSSSSPKNCVVVTDDRDLAIFARRCGAQVMDTPSFLKKGSAARPRLKGSSSSGADKAGLNIVEREKITNELGRLWLKKK